MAQQPPVGQGLFFIEASRSHSDTRHLAGLLWTRDRPVANTSQWQHTTLTRDRHPWPRRDSNPQSQQVRSRRPTPSKGRLLEPAKKYILNSNYMNGLLRFVRRRGRTPSLSSLSHYLVGVVQYFRQDLAIWSSKTKPKLLKFTWRQTKIQNKFNNFKD